MRRTPPAFDAGAGAQVPRGRVGTPDEVAKGTVLLAPDDASFVDGVERFVDGGVAQG